MYIKNISVPVAFLECVDCASIGGWILENMVINSNAVMQFPNNYVGVTFLMLLAFCYYFISDRRGSHLTWILSMLFTLSNS